MSEEEERNEEEEQERNEEEEQNEEGEEQNYSQNESNYKNQNKRGKIQNDEEEEEENRSKTQSKRSLIQSDEEKNISKKQSKSSLIHSDEEEEIISKKDRHEPSTIKSRSKEAGKIFDELKSICDKITPNNDANSVTFEALRTLKHSSKEAESPALDFLLKRQPIYQINNSKDFTTPKTITREEFIKLFSGEDLQDLILDHKDLYNQRLYVEDFTQLFKVLGGSSTEVNIGGEDKRAISKENLRKRIFEYYHNRMENDKLNNVPNLCNEIFDLLATKDEDYITIDDFVNIMTSISNK